MFFLAKNHIEAGEDRGDQQIKIKRSHLGLRGIFANLTGFLLKTGIKGGLVRIKKVDQILMLIRVGGFSLN